MPPPLHALLISVSSYLHPDWPPLPGAQKDSARLQNYLLTQLHVPPSNILLLHNTQATRSGILEGIRKHLLERKAVKKGDAVLIAFSGHGSRSEAPEGWAVVDDNEKDEGEEESGGGGPLLEMIIPYDESTPDASGYPICGIPDRTLGVLLNLLAAKVGDNITVILDCCHSGHGTRGPLPSPSESEENRFTVRGLDPSLITPLRADVDQPIWDMAAAEEGGQQQQQQQQQRASTPHVLGRGGFTSHRAKSHVLLAACGQHELAVGEDRGGLLTTYLLKALQNPSIHPRTYAEIMKHVDKDLGMLRAQYPKYVKQHAQCEGVTRDRLVFEDTIADPRLFRATHVGARSCRIEAGEVQGIKAGTIFELYQMGQDLRRSVTLGTAVARKVEATYCLADVAEGMRLVGGLYTALVLQQAYKLRFCVVNRSPNSRQAIRIQELLEASLRRADAEFAGVLDRVGPGARGVDLVLEIDGNNGGGITFVRRDVLLRDLITHSPRLTASDVEEANFPVILNAIARFNFYLGQTSQVRPYAAEVDFEFYKLEPDPNYDEFDDTPLTKARSLEKYVDFKNDEVHIVEKETDDYAFVLRNSSSVPLFPHIIYFDTGTYQIETWYTPFVAEKPTLLPNAMLQVGASPEHNPPFRFFIREGDKVDTSFIKVFLLDTQAQMGFMDQTPVMGYDEEGQSYVKSGIRGGRGAGIDAPARRGGWDSLTRKITVGRVRSR